MKWIMVKGGKVWVYYFMFFLGILWLRCRLLFLSDEMKKFFGRMVVKGKIEGFWGK